MSEKGCLVLTMKDQQVVTVGNDIKLTFNKSTKTNQWRVVIEAPKDLKIDRVVKSNSCKIIKNANDDI